MTDLWVVGLALAGVLLVAAIISVVVLWVVYRRRSSSSSSSRGRRNSGWQDAWSKAGSDLDARGFTAASGCTFAVFGSDGARRSTYRPSAGRTFNDARAAKTNGPGSGGAGSGSGSATGIAVLSVNWGGYASFYSETVERDTDTVERASGSWTVPTLETGPATGGEFSVAWVGIDGYTSPTVEQIGTEHDWVDGVPTYFAWFELFPLPPFEIVEFPVAPGDRMHASVTYVGDNLFLMVLVNLTQSAYVVIPPEYSAIGGAQRSSADWIVERPSDGSGFLPLAHYGSIEFTRCHACIGKRACGKRSTRTRQGAICKPCRDFSAISTVETGGTPPPISTPSQLDADCDSFTISRT